MEILDAKQEKIVLSKYGSYDPRDIQSYISAGGYSGFKQALALGPERVISEIEAAGLFGRDENGTWTSDKWKQCEQQDKPKYVICNAIDTDPNCSIPSMLIENDPHAILEGILICAYAVGAEKGIIMINPGNTQATNRLKSAISQVEANGFMGKNILGTSFCFRLEIAEGEKHLIYGEQTALINALEGKPVMASQTPPYPAVCGFKGRPTIIENTETLVNVAVILQKGASWYAQFGSGKSKGTKLLQISGDVKAEGIVEVSIGTTLKSVIYEICGGIRDNKEFKFALVGGPTGSCLPQNLLDNKIGPEPPEEAGAGWGSGSIVVYAQDSCVVDMAKNSIALAYSESCGKCVFCREGTYQIHQILSDMTTGKSKQNDLEMLSELCSGIQEGSLCSLGKRAPNPVITTLRYFGDEYVAHMKRKKCPALVCKNYITYHILPDKCTGCGKCLEKCPEEAIEGEEGMIHVIDTTSCIKCGVCFDICLSSEASAVVRAGAIKPKTPKGPIPIGSWKKS